MPNVFTNKALRLSVQTKCFLVDDGEHVLSFRNYTAGIYYEVHFDGNEVYRGKTPPPNAPKKWRKAPLPDGRECQFQVSNGEGVSARLDVYRYELKIDGEDIPIDTEGRWHPWSPANEKRPQLNQCVSIPEARLGLASDGEGMEGVVLYRVQLRPQEADDFAAAAEWKRFNHFDELYTLALSYYFDCPTLLSSVPRCPDKTWRKHTDAAFIEERRRGLEDFLVKLCQMPRMMHNPDVLVFLGLFEGNQRMLMDTTKPVQGGAKRMTAAFEPEPETSGVYGLSDELAELLEACTEDSVDKAPTDMQESLRGVAARPVATSATAIAQYLGMRLALGLESSNALTLKCLTLMVLLAKTGSPIFCSRLAAECQDQISAAAVYSKSDPEYGDKPAALIRKHSAALASFLEESASSRSEFEAVMTGTSQTTTHHSNSDSDDDVQLFGGAPPRKPPAKPAAAAAVSDDDDDSDDDDCL